MNYCIIYLLKQFDVSEFICLLVYLFVSSKRAEILGDDSPWDADGFRLKDIYIWSTICQKTENNPRYTSNNPHYIDIHTSSSLMSITLRVAEITGSTDVECATLDLEVVGSNLDRWCYRKSLQFCSCVATSNIWKS